MKVEKISGVSKIPVNSDHKGDNIIISNERGLIEYLRSFFTSPQTIIATCKVEIAHAHYPMNHTHVLKDPKGVTFTLTFRKTGTRIVRNVTEHIYTCSVTSSSGRINIIA